VPAGPSPEQLRKESEEKLQQAIESEKKREEEDKKRRAAQAEHEKRVAAEARRVALLEQQKAAADARRAREALCEVKPVMSDDDIQKCRIAAGR
jgi:hypothetical protein